MNDLKQYDPELYGALVGELERQQNQLELIASENIVSPRVLTLQGNPMTNKYAEGYPGRRYYGGCEFVDVAEQLAIDRARQLFGVDYANVQPHSGSQANMGVYFATMQPGDTYLGMNLSHGGHLTHGSPVNFSGKLFKVVPYGVDPKTHIIDMDQVRDLAREHKPKLIVVGASAYPRTIDFPAFRAIADEAGCKLMVDMAHIAGLVAAGEHPSPVPHAEYVTTTTHKTLRGPRGGMVLSRESEAKALGSNMFPGIQGGPLMHVIAAKAVAFKEALSPEFKAYQQQIVRNAKALAESLLGLGYTLISGGTDNHLMILNMDPLGMTGKETQELLDRAGITTSRSTIPFDTRSPFVTSGVRVGTPAVTSRGLKEAEMKTVAALIDKAIKNRADESAVSKVKSEVRDLCGQFPIYTGYLKENFAGA